jgi:hypothetical protein
MLCSLASLDWRGAFSALDAAAPDLRLGGWMMTRTAVSNCVFDRGFLRNVLGICYRTICAAGLPAVKSPGSRVV